MKAKQSIIITKAFHKISDKAGRKPNKIWVDKGSKFYKKSVKSWLQDDNIKTYSAHNEGKSVVFERFYRTLKNRIYKYVSSVSKYAYIDKLDNVVSKYNNTYHCTIKVKSAGVKSSTYIDFNKKISKDHPTFKVSNHVKISKYKNIFAKDYVSNWSKEAFMIKKVDNAVL